MWQIQREKRHVSDRGAGQGVRGEGGYPAFLREEWSHLARHSQRVRLSPLWRAGQAAAGVHHPRQVGGVLAGRHRRTAGSRYQQGQGHLPGGEGGGRHQARTGGAEDRRADPFSRQPAGALQHLLRRPALGGALRHPRDPGIRRSLPPRAP